MVERTLPATMSDASPGGGTGPLLRLGRQIAAELKIGDLARLTGKTQRALRLYEEMGLLTPGTRTSGGFRLYDERSVERVEFITKLHDLGFTLVEMQALIRASSGESMPKEAMAEVRKLYAAKQQEVAQQIARLEQLQNELKQSLHYLEKCVATCTEQHSGTACCGTCSAHGDTAAPGLVSAARSEDKTIQRSGGLS